MTDLEQCRKEIDRRSREDFDFMVLCESKRNMGMYHLLRDDSLEADRKRLAADEAFFGITP